VASIFSVGRNSYCRIILLHKQCRFDENLPSLANALLEINMADKINAIEEFISILKMNLFRKIQNNKTNSCSQFKLNL